MISELLKTVIMVVAAFAAGFAGGFLIRRYAIQDKIKKQQQRAEELLGKAETEASEIVLCGMPLYP